MKVYQEMIKEVQLCGTRKENRTGVDTFSTFNFNYELAWGPEMFFSPIQHRQAPADGVLPGHRYIMPVNDQIPGTPIPLLTTKEVSWKNIVVEMLWFLSGDTSIEILKRHKCKFWDPWADEDGKVPSAYGNFWRHFPVHDYVEREEGGTGELPMRMWTETQPGFNDQLAWVLGELRRNPMSRRLVVSAWAPGNAQTSKLPPCHLLFAFNVQNVPVKLNGPDPDKAEYEPRLCLHLTQRSCDLALGVPYNMASYGLLLAIMSHLSGIKPGIFAHTLLDLHIYTKKPNGSMEEYDHMPGLSEQLKRTPRKVPSVVIDPSIKELSDIEALMKPEVSTGQILERFALQGYEPNAAIPFKVAV